MSELIAAGTGPSAWFDVTVAAGATKALFIKPAGGDGPAPAGVDFELAHKTSGGNYTTFDVLNASNYRLKGGLVFAATYGVRRMPSAVSAGMDVEG